VAQRSASGLQIKTFLWITSAKSRTEGVRKIAERFGVAVGTVQRISRPFELGAEAVSAA
jgi:hypothetical protein